MNLEQSPGLRVEGLQALLCWGQSWLTPTGPAFLFIPNLMEAIRLTLKENKMGLPVPGPDTTPLVGTLLWSESSAFPHGLLFSCLVGQAVALFGVAVEPLGSCARVTEVYP